MLDLPMEIAAIFSRWVRKLVRRPTNLFFSLVQPLIWFLLFTQAFQAVANIPGFAQITGTSSYLTFFSAAVIVQTVLTSALQSGLGMVDDVESGYLDKMRVTPVRRASILMGKVFSDGFRIVIQVMIIIALAYVLNVRVITGLPGILLILLLAMSFGIAWSGISTFVALTTRNSESTLVISIMFVFPLLFLSTAVMPKEFLAPWVQTFSMYNPVSYVADAVRSLIIQGYDWAVIGQAFLAILIVGAVTLTATTMMFRRALSK
ncbi:MAG: ABC transporter permease [Methanomassiliicoccus sp.]|nr:ABC transporter permease [Methanomassiliicoccus sp.]